MQRYPAASCGGGISNHSVGGASVRDTARADTSFPSSNFSLNPRRPLQLAPYKLTCEKEPLSARLGPPDYYPQTPNCPEETLTRDYVQHGYKETVDGLEEAREITLSQIGTFSKPVVVKCKEAIRKRLRAINESRAQKRKAGQVYGVPLSGSLLTRPCVFPEQRPCGEDFRKKWIESLSQQHKRLRLLAENVPHGYRRKSLFEVLIRHNVPLLRATWFIKVTYLNQVRPISTSVSSGAPDKTQLARSELWTKDVVEYLQYLLDEFFSKDGSMSTPQARNQSSQMLLVGCIQQKGDSSPAFFDGDEPSFHFKWWYMVRILQWHHAEGLLIPSQIIEWVLNQMQEKESFETLELLLPVVFGVLETIALSQTYVRTLVEVAVRCIQEPSPGGSSLLDNSRRAYMISSLVEMLRYLIVAVPDTFVALDCFPLPSCLLSEAANDRSFLLKDGERIPNGEMDFANTSIDKGLDIQNKFLSFDHTISSIQKRVDNLVKAVSPGVQGNGMAKAVQALDKALILGDVKEAYKYLFEDLCDHDVEEVWIAEVSPCLRASLKWIGTVSLSLVCSVFFVCEWATCDFRDCRTAIPPGLKLTGRKDYSQVYIAVQLLKLQMEVIHSSGQCKEGILWGTESIVKGGSQRDSFPVATAAETMAVNKSKSKIAGGKIDAEDIFQSPGPMHDIVVCWIDQHEVGKGEGYKRLQLLIVELISAGIFYPQAYVRQLIISGVMERNETPVDLGRRQRHYRILKQLPGSYLMDFFKEARVTSIPLLSEAMQVYSNERRFVLHGLSTSNNNGNDTNCVPKTQKDNSASGREAASPASSIKTKVRHSASSPLAVRDASAKSLVAELKNAISTLLSIPHSFSALANTREDSQGVKRPIGLSGTVVESVEGTDGCEECKRAKRPKLGEERSSYQLGIPSNPLDDEDAWWVKKGSKSLESFKVDPPLKSTKNVSRGRRKTQSLAQLAAARIEGSQGASTSHICDNKISCPHHRSGVEGENSKTEGSRKTHLSDIIKIGKALKRLRLLERRTITLWLMTIVRQLVEGNEKPAAKVGQNPGSVPPDDRATPSWKFGEHELFAIIYLMDVASDLVSATKFLLWLLPKISNGLSSTLPSGRSLLIMSKNAEAHVCEVGEAFLLSTIRRYENVIVVNDLLPEALSAMMRQAAAVMVSNGRASSSSAFNYARNLLKKYGSSGSVAKWEKNFRATCDQRLLTELESGRSLDGEFGFSSGVPAGVEDFDSYLHQKITGRLSRPAPSMKEVVQRYTEEAVQYFYDKERKLVGSSTQKSPGIEKWDDEFQMAQKIVLALMDCIRQNGGATQEVDHSLVAAAVAAIVSNVGLAVAKMPDFTTSGNHPKLPSPVSLLSCAWRIVHIHITCLSLLKEALGERQCRVFEIALATEASSAVAGSFAPGKVSRGQFPEGHDANMSNQIVNNSAKSVLGRATKAAAAVSALVIGAIVHGVVSLERMVTVFRLKEGLDILHFIRSARSNSNGISRSIGMLKVDHSIEICVHWFRLLIGNCRTVSDGLVVELLGEPYIVALSRMQRMLPLSLVFPPAYSTFAMVIWRPYLLNGNITAREDVQVYQSLTVAIADAIRHQPFRDVCLRDSSALYDLLASDVGDSEFAAMLELHGPDKHLKTVAFVPLRARLFLNAILDGKVPQSMLAHGDASRVTGHGESKVQYAENEMKLINQLVHVLDTIQPAKFHWQWVELRLLLNEQVLIEKIEGPYNMSVVEAIRSLLPNSDNVNLSENENNFTDIVLTRLLVRPDAASLYSEVVHLLGRPLEESLLLHAKWFLAGHDVLFGRKSVRQRLINIAQNRGLSTKIQFWKPWGWTSSAVDTMANRVDKKFEPSSLEEGEVVEEGMDLKRSGKMTSQTPDTEGSTSRQQYATERALAELVLPCMDRSSSDARNTFANELIKQLNSIEIQINLVAGGSSKQAGIMPLGVEGAANKGNTRKGIRGGSPGLGRRSMGASDSAPPSSAALRASLWLRLQFLLRLLPVIHADREPSSRNMRHLLASVILRLLGSRVVYEDIDSCSSPMQNSFKRLDSLLESSVSAASGNLFGESLFDQFLSVLYGLLSSWKPRWLKPKSSSKSTAKSPRDFSVFDREVAESLQTDLDRMLLPETIRWRLQAAMPVLSRFPSCSISCQPPTVSTAALASLQFSISSPGFQHGNSSQSQRNRASANTPGKSKSLLSQDQEMEIDPWTLLEDGTGSGPSTSNSIVGVVGDHTNLKACHWLKGAVRVRRTDLTYIGAVDDDS
ncbi:hypothetical protein AQUCO_01300301v1 [Aquilegia coerulea]|uniref:Mediator complex subunit Med12 domain-containing protein n=1 Tax=Aquilegia coerulea TaxID=218851 RepID=A0A2G5E0T5_AQUCA|nr:hypothetical protein AQUCO_01300301v1 [Aquilegia coerulea]PIA49388.1 hypothetical protein AQUCO_01300301v1 [Aquilegia coerulea]PIA49389.1 hypothetical protein AQUCO_01300301v1 [Aquilegia coerulea]